MSRSAFIEIKRNDFNEIENKFKDHSEEFPEEVEEKEENKKSTDNFDHDPTTVSAKDDRVNDLNKKATKETN